MIAHLVSLSETADVTVTVAKKGEEYLLVVSLKNDKLDYLKRVPPLIVKAKTAEELEAEFNTACTSLVPLFAEASSNVEQVASALKNTKKSAPAPVRKNKTDEEREAEAEAEEAESKVEADAPKEDTKAKKEAEKKEAAEKREAERKAAAEAKEKEKLEKEAKKAYDSIKVADAKYKQYFEGCLKKPEMVNDYLTLLGTKITADYEDAISKGVITKEQITQKIREHYDSLVSAGPVESVNDLFNQAVNVAVETAQPNVETAGFPQEKPFVPAVTPTATIPSPGIPADTMDFSNDGLF